MKPNICENCCAHEFIELDDAYVCAYCDSRFAKQVPAASKAEYKSPYKEIPAPEDVIPGRRKNKWIALLLCIFIGYYGAHKFYEEKIGMGVLYLFTGGLFFAGWIIDIFVLLKKPNPYYIT